MKIYLKHILIWFGLSLALVVLWIGGLMIGNALFPSNLLDSGDSNDSNGLVFLLICMLNSGVILYFINNSRARGFKLSVIVFLISFGIQYFMSQIETLWFNDSLNMPINLIFAIVCGGAISLSLFSLLATYVTGNFSRSQSPAIEFAKPDVISMTKRVLVLSLVLWPLIYFLAGYTIAWQFADVRLFYSGTTEMESLYTIMKGNITSGLYFFQILRGLLWVLIAFAVLSTSTGSWVKKGIILGLLLSILGSSGLLLPNPIMSETIRIAHLLETSTSSFVWGIILAWTLGKYFTNEVANPVMNILSPKRILSHGN